VHVLFARATYQRVSRRFASLRRFQICQIWVRGVSCWCKKALGMSEKTIMSFSALPPQESGEIKKLSLRDKRSAKASQFKSNPDSFNANNTQHAEKMQMQNAQQTQMPPFETYYPPYQQSYPDYAYANMSQNMFVPPPTGGSNPAHCLTVTQRDVEYHMKNTRDTFEELNSLIIGSDLANQVNFYVMRVDAILSNHYRRQR